VKRKLSNCIIPKTSTDHKNYKSLDDVESPTIRRELPHYIGGIINEIIQGEQGGYMSKSFIKEQLERMMDTIDYEYAMDN
tara:strand:+ start:2034 stop:2273 length:240 start_codon:yes stop_codon:yes gene_type:complete